MNSTDGDYKKGLPLLADRDLVTDFGDKNYPNSPNLPVQNLKPIFCRYGADRNGAGTSPVVFADGHVKAYSANGLNSFGTVVWRFR